MTPFGPVRYLVAWAGDKRTKDALALADVLARTFGAALDIVYIVREEAAGTGQHPNHRQYEKAVADQARTWVSAAADSVGDDVDVATHVFTAPSVSSGILDAAHVLGSALIVIGGGSGSKHPIAANPIVGALLHASTVPVAMAPSGYSVRGKLDELVCAVGTRPGAQQVIEEALTGVERVGLGLRLISLVDLDGADRAASKRARTAAKEALTRAEQSVRGRSAVRTEVGAGKNLRQAVKRIHWSQRSALLIGSSRLARGRSVFLGTTATRLLAHVKVPLIIVPAPG